MDTLGLIFELVFLGIGIFVYRFSIGKVQFHNTQQPLAEQFRRENGSWLRLLSLALIAMMVIEIGLHILAFFKK